jgi:hypothetical protein
LFRNLRQSEALQRIFANPQVEKFMVPTRGGNQRELRIQLNREPEKFKTLEPPKGEAH